MLRSLLAAIVVLVAVISGTTTTYAQIDGSWHVIYGPSSAYVTSILVTHSGTYLAATSSTGIYRKASKNWEAVTTGLETSHIFCLYRIDDTTILAGTNAGAYYSNDDGLSWNKLGGGIPDVTVNAFTYTRVGNLFSGTENGGGIYRSSDRGDSWGLLNAGLSSASITALATNGLGFLFAGTFSGFYVSADNGSDWKRTDTSILKYSRVTALMNDSSNVLYVTTQDHGVFYSYNNGGVWRDFNTSLPTVNVTCIAVTSTNHFFTGTKSNGLFRAIGRGAEWKQITSLDTTEEITAVTIGPNNEVIVGTKSGVHISTDDGQHWSDADIGIWMRGVQRVTATRNNIYFAQSDLGVYASSDSGRSWTLQSTSVPTTVDSLHAMGADSLGNLYEATERGLLRSTNNGRTWSVSSTNKAYSFGADRRNRVYFGTRANGAVQRSLDSGKTFQQVINYNQSDHPSTILIVDTEVYAGMSSGSVYQWHGRSGVFNRSSFEEFTSGVNALAFGKDNKLIAGTANDGVFVTDASNWIWGAKDQGLPGLAITSMVSDSQAVYALTNYGVYSTTDNGENWYSFNRGIEDITPLDLFISPSKELLLYTRQGDFYRFDKPIPISSVKAESANALHISIYPNPCTGASAADLAIERDGNYRLTLCDVTGRERKELYTGNYAKGIHHVQFQAGDLAAGTYFLVLAGNSTSVHQQIAVVR